MTLSSNLIAVSLAVQLTFLTLCGCSTFNAPKQNAMNSGASIHDSRDQRKAFASINKLAPNASGVCLANVVSIVPYDHRPSDGNKGFKVTLRQISGSGQFNDTIHIITEYGGHTESGITPEPPNNLINPDSLTTGKQYLFAFASKHDYKYHPQSVIGFWPASDTKVSKSMQTAIQNNVYRWNPQFDPETQLTYGRLQSSKQDWEIRVNKGEKVLWKKTVLGTMSTRSRSWTLDEYAKVNFPDVAETSCGKLLVAETATYLRLGNEYGLPVGAVYLRTAFEPETGKRLHDQIRQQGPQVALLTRTYNPTTGEVEKEVKTKFAKPTEK